MTARCFSGSVSSLDSSSGSPEIISSKKFYGKGLAFKNNSKRTSLQNENNAEELLNNHTDDDYLESICSQFDTKLHARRSTAKVIGQRDTSKEYAHVAAKAKKGNRQLFYPKHEECIVVSDDSSSDMDRGDIPSVKEETAVKVEVKTKNEKSDDSWVIIDEEEEPMVKIKGSSRTIEIICWGAGGRFDSGSVQSSD